MWVLWCHPTLLPSDRYTVDNLWILSLSLNAINLSLPPASIHPRSTVSSPQYQPGSRWPAAGTCPGVWRHVRTSGYLTSPGPPTSTSREAITVLSLPDALCSRKIRKSLCFLPPSASSASYPDSLTTPFLYFPPSSYCTSLLLPTNPSLSTLLFSNNLPVYFFFPVSFLSSLLQPVALRII